MAKGILVSRHIPEKATHLVRAYAGKALLAEVWVHGWGTVETETEVFKTLPQCDRVEVCWLRQEYEAFGPKRPYGTVETVWKRNQ